MILLKESFIYQLWLWLLAAYEASTVHRCLTACGAWCNRQIDGSAVLGVLCREGAVARAWPDSLLCRVLTALVNLPARLLHLLYGALARTFEDS